MRLLLLGGTSFFGKEICRTFVDASWEVTLFTRGNVTPNDLPSHAHIRGDRNVEADLQLAAEAGPWDLVIDNIAYNGPQVQQALGAFKDCGRYLLMSTVSVYRFVRSKDQPLHEDRVDFEAVPKEEDSSDVHWKYARGKLEAEKALLAEKNVPWTVLRPPVVYGPDDVTSRGFWYLARLLEGGPLLLGDSGSQSFRLIYSKDIAQACLAAAQTNKAEGRAYNLSQQEVITLRQFVEDSARALGVPLKSVSAPTEILGDMAGPYAGMVNLVPDLTRVKEELDFRATPWSVFGPSTAQWFKERGKQARQSLLEGRDQEIQLAKKIRAFYQTVVAPTP